MDDRYAEETQRLEREAALRDKTGVETKQVSDAIFNLAVQKIAGNGQIPDIYNAGPKEEVSVNPVVNRIVAFDVYKNQGTLPSWLDSTANEKVNYITSTIYPIAEEYIQSNGRLAEEKKAEMRFEDKVDFKTAVSYLLAAQNETPEWLTEEEKQDVQRAKDEFTIMANLAPEPPAINPTQERSPRAQEQNVGQELPERTEEEIKQMAAPQEDLTPSTFDMTMPSPRSSNPTPIGIEIVKSDEIYKYIIACFRKKTRTNYLYYITHEAAVDVYLKKLTAIIDDLIKRLVRLKSILPLPRKSRMNPQQLTEFAKLTSEPIRGGGDEEDLEMDIFDAFLWTIMGNIQTPNYFTHSTIESYIKWFIFPNHVADTSLPEDAYTKIDKYIEYFTMVLECIQKLPMLRKQADTLPVSQTPTVGQTPRRPMIRRTIKTTGGRKTKRMLKKRRTKKHRKRFTKRV
jgi:hypothetical protein